MGLANMNSGAPLYSVINYILIYLQVKTKQMYTKKVMQYKKISIAEPLGRPQYAKYHLFSSSPDAIPLCSLLGLALTLKSYPAASSQRSQFQAI